MKSNEPERSKKDIKMKAQILEDMQSKMSPELKEYVENKQKGIRESKEQAERLKNIQENGGVYAMRVKKNQEERKILNKIKVKLEKISDNAELELSNKNSLLKEENKRLREEVKKVEKVSGDELFVMGIRDRERKVLELEEKIHENEKETIKINRKPEEDLKKAKENKSIQEGGEDGTMEEIAELLKNNKIDQTIVAGEKDRSNEDGLILRPDLDARTALYLLNNYNKKTLEETYADHSMTSLIGKDSSGQDLIEDNKIPEKFIKMGGKGLDSGEKTEVLEKNGLRIFIDVGGTWMKVEKENGKTITIRIDHHGIGSEDGKPTSGTKMIYEIMEKAGILKEIPDWLNKFIKFVNEVDNLSYLEEKDKDGNKIFDENYLRNEWPSSMYAIAEKGIPFEKLIEICQARKRRGPSSPFTEEELDSELGATQIGDTTIKELCVKAREGDKSKKEKNIEGVEKILEGVKNAKRYAKQEKLNLENTILGKVIYHNFGFIKPEKGKPFQVRILHSSLAFIATKAIGYDTFISWDNEKKRFHINSNHPNLSRFAEKLNEIDPGCAKDVRGTFIFGKINNLTEKQLLKILNEPLSKKIIKKKTIPEQKITTDTPTKIEVDKEKKTIETRENKEKDTISDAEYADFVDNNKVNNDILENIAEKNKNGEPLSDRERAIFSYKTADIEKILTEIKKEEEQTIKDETESTPVEIKTEIEPEPIPRTSPARVNSIFETEGNDSEKEDEAKQILKKLREKIFKLFGKKKRLK